MLVTIIGSGNIATVMGRVLVAAGHSIQEVYSRNPQHATTLSDELHARPVNDLSQISGSSDLYLIAVADDAIGSVAEQLSLPGKLVIHTAGSVSKQLLSPVSGQYGVFWPVKMVRKNMQSLKPVTAVIDGSNAEVTEQVKQFAGIFSDTILVADDEKRLKMHTLASFTLNFSNHLFHLAADFSEKEGIDFSIFYPLIAESVQRLQYHHPRDLQAGPAFRGDRKTIEKHLRVLSNHPHAANIYRVLTESILSTFKKSR